MPTGRRQLAVSVVNGKIYAIGGYVNQGQPGLSTVEEYDPVTDTWTNKASMPTERFGLATCVVDGRLYAIGGAAGYDVLSTVEVYDPVEDTWISKTGMPNPRTASANLVKGKIYCIGGALTVRPPHPAVSTVEEYRPSR